jgi:hypothetical protein
MLELLDPAWINGWTGRMGRTVTSTISNMIPNTGIALCSSTTNTGSMDFCITQGTTIHGSSYVRYASTPLSTSIILIEASWTELSNGARA